MVVSLDTTVGTIDTISKSFYEYDNLGRSTKDLTTSYYSNNIPKPFEQDKTFYFYNGIDSLPYKTVMVNFDSSGSSPDLIVDSFVHFYTYNSSNIIIRDSVFYVQFYRSIGAAQGNITTHTSNYTIYADSVIEMSRYAYTIGGIATVDEGKDKYVQTKLNGNLLKEMRYILDVPGGYRLLGTIDNKYQVFPGIVSGAGGYPVDQGLFGAGYSSKDLKIEFTKTDQFGYSSTNKTIYTFDSLGYLRVTVDYDPAFPADAIKSVYIYMK
jgi:hypothetical protein